MTTGASLPIVDLAPWRDRAATEAARDNVAVAIDKACQDPGFFYTVGHGVADDLVSRLDFLAREFFADLEADKAEIEMSRGGRAWRGWFPVGGELTSGRPDQKEGIYFGAELEREHPRVTAGVPLHGGNLFPSEPEELKRAVLAYIAACTAVGHTLAAAMSRGLGLDDNWCAEHLTADPTVLFRIFHYPGSVATDDWGVGEHTDYGLLTILAQDRSGGLAVHTPSGWVDAPPVDGAFVVNVGDMLERVTRGRYRSTPHRVRNSSGASRISMAFFFDPSWDAEVLPVPTSQEIAAQAARPRWDGADPHAFHGTYGEYLIGKVAKVFPDLGHDVLP